MNDSDSTSRFIPLGECRPAGLPLHNLEALYDELDRRSIPVDSLLVRIYPYRGVVSRLSRRHRVYRLGLHPVLSQAPEEVFRAAMSCLFARFSGEPVTDLDRRRVTEFCRTAAMETTTGGRTDLNRPLVPRGRHVDLATVFDVVNQQYFDGEIRIRGIGWTRRRNRRRLASYSPTSNVIVVSRLLDHPAVPHFFLEYILFHEMLHVLLPAERRGGRVIYHHRRFRQMERTFPHFDAARAFEKRLHRLH